MKLEKEITIGVIVPVYNVKDYLKDCIDSLTSQTEAFDEIILVNDGSTDGSGEICRAYSRKFLNIRLIEQENQGLSMARNAGMKRAESEYLVFVDADDYVSRDMVHNLKNKLKDNTLEVLYFNAECFSELKDGICDKAQLMRDPGIVGQLMSGIEYLDRSLKTKVIVSACTAAYQRTFLEKYAILFPKGLYYEDNVFYIDVVLHAMHVECLAKCLYFRRWRENSIMTGARSIKKCKDLLEIQRIIWSLIDAYPLKLEYKKQFRDFISARMITAFGTLAEYATDLEVQRYAKGWIRDFVERCLVFYEGEQLTWNDAYLLCKISFELGSFKENSILTEYADKRLKEILEQRLRKLPFGWKEKKVGVYGVGTHTQRMLFLYQKVVGEIKAEIYFIVSDVPVQRSFMGKKVVECAKIPEDTDYVIVSSLLYRKEMKAQLEKEQIAKNKVIDLYDAQDKCDLVLVEQILKIKQG